MAKYQKNIVKVKVGDQISFRATGVLGSNSVTGSVKVVAGEGIKVLLSSGIFYYGVKWLPGEVKSFQWESISNIRFINQ